jgi:acetolactate synthase-1/2/3 large subunit
MAMTRMLGADAILRCLEAEGVDVAFGIPGGAILPTYDAFARGTTVRHVLARHEQGAGHMAEGYARASGKVGVAIATSGPGATNLVTPIADAWMDSTPLVCVSEPTRSRRPTRPGSPCRSSSTRGSFRTSRSCRA